MFPTYQFETEVYASEFLLANKGLDILQILIDVDLKNNELIEQERSLIVLLNNKDITKTLSNLEYKNIMREINRQITRDANKILNSLIEQKEEFFYV